MQILKQITTFAPQFRAMRFEKKIQNVILWVMLAVIAIAYTGKALHTHTDSYYDSLRTTRNAASNGMSDDCPICHFNLLFFIFEHQANFAFYTALLTIIIAFQPILRSKIVVRNTSLRAPPALL